MKKLFTLVLLLWGVIASAQAIRFDYRGTEFVVSNNDIQVVLDGNEWNNGITRNYQGQITFINGIYLGYDYQGRIQWIGGITISRNYDGLITRIGGMTLRYNWRGEFVGAYGRVNF